MNSWNCKKLILQKILTRIDIVLAPAAKTLGTSRFSIGCMIWQAACCHFGADMRNQLDHNFPSHSTDGIPHSSSHLLSSSRLLPFTWTTYSQFNSLSPFYSLGRNYSKSKFILLFAPFGKKFSKSHFPSDL